MKVPSFVVSAIARKLHIPDLATKMFEIAITMSGLDKSTVPVELLPLNAIQLSRGLLNFTAIQTLNGWVLPFWAEQQYDPRSPAFIPRSHLGLSMNVTHRNWTGVGNPWCAVEPIVDPRGMVTLFPNGWSIDTWVRCDERSCFPSRTESVRQSLHGGLPMVITTFDADQLRVRIDAYTAGSRFIQRVSVTTVGDRPVAGAVGIAVRPFNPEGVAPINTLGIGKEGLDIVINDSDRLHFGSVPSRIVLANKEIGDSAWLFSGGRTGQSRDQVTCQSGFANGVAEYALALDPHEEWTCVLWYDLEPATRSDVPSIQQAAETWRACLEEGTRCDIPDAQLSALMSASHAALLMSLDSSTVKPGPATYHYFWFRDAAYMLLALDRLGHGSLTRPVIAGYPALQDSSGMFRSQQGEWDSTGQAIWSIWQHAMLTHNTNILGQLFTAMKRAIGWIEETREKRRDDPLRGGLLPRGLSAEHLGLADIYYWDAFWSLAGIEAFVRVCQVLRRPDEESRARALATSLRADLERSITTAMASQGISVIPPGPLRNPDAGMIGSIAAWYPLQLFSPDDPRMRSTLEAILDTWFHQGMFYQPIVHSGLNAYLTLQTAQAALYGGDAEMFWQILRNVSQRATSTYTYPEAIHPLTGGGSMGDGHHAWASAEVALAVRNSFILERWTGVDRPHTLTLLGGIPEELYRGSKEFSIRNAPLPEGAIDIAVSPGDSQTEIAVTFRKKGFVPAGTWMLSLPAGTEHITIEGNHPLPLQPGSGRQTIGIPAETQRILCDFSGDA